ncbi:hypothetical protein ACLMJK_001188 [Lecanora helva]
MGESPGKMYAIAIVFTLLAMVAVGLRFHARHLKRAGYSWDEYMIVPALIFTFATAICIIVGAAIGDLGRHTPIDDTDFPIVTHRLIVVLQVMFATYLSTTLAIGFTKLSVLLFYKRIFQGTLIDIAVWTNIAIVAAWTVGFFLSNVFQCWPISTNWATPGEQTWGSCVDMSMMNLAQAYSDVFTDVLILAVPIPCVWSMTMPVKHKFAVSGIFLLGVLTVCSGIAKIVVYNRANYLMNNGDADIAYITTPTIYWPMIESAVGIVGACLPLLRPLFSRGSESKRFGQVRNLRSVRLPSSSSQETPELKPWGDDTMSQGTTNVSEVSIRRIVPSALEPWEERKMSLPRRADDQV